MPQVIAELTLERGDAKRPRPPQVPEQVFTYALGFLETSRDSLRFLWRDNTRWLGIHLVRKAGAGSPVVRAPFGGQAFTQALYSSTDRVSLRISELEMPRAVTVREIDVLTLVALGLTNAGIAERLGTSARTVSTQIERLLTKMDQGTRGGLAALAVDSGLLRLPIPGGVDGSAGIGVVELESVVSAVPRTSQAPLRPSYPRKRPIYVGTLIPTGAAGADGVEVLNGSQLAVDELNATGGVGGRSIELVTAHVDLFDWNSVQRGLGDLFSKDVDAITTSYASAENMAMVDLIADFGKPFLHTATFEEQVQLVESNQARYGAIFQTCASENHYGGGLFRLLTDLEVRGVWRPRSRRMVSIEVDSSSTHVTTESFISTADRAGWSVDELITVPLHVVDWSRIIQRLAELDPEVVMITHFLDSEVARFQVAFAAARLPALAYFIYAASIPAFGAAAGPFADGAIWSTTTGTYDDLLGRRFRDQYVTRFGHRPGWSQAGSAYDQVRLLASAWSATSSRRTSDVVQYLRRLPHRGVNGVYYFGERSQSTLSYPDVTPDASMGQAHMVYQIQDGEHRPLGPEPFGTAAAFRRPSWFPPALTPSV